MAARVNLHDVIQWEVRSWSRVLPLWERHLPAQRPARFLGIGEREGGLSLWFASLGHDVLCTDLRPFPPATRALHERNGLAERIRYDQADATALPYPEGSFDGVFFKSVIGALGSKERQQQAIAEMHRVLKPGGVLYFAENLHGTWLHQWLRKRFVSWNVYWRYLDVEADSDLFSPFTRLEGRTTGLLANLGRSEGQRDMLARVDPALVRVLPRSMHAIWYGVAIKDRS
ncbi:MAG TPA: class I SAM-dependent methyltransferase [Flavobacteriales bacterium]|nr:class I SAM-dependent methyltransferase [Flavobacteriales bacterium]